MRIDTTIGLAAGLAADAVAVCIALSLTRAHLPAATGASTGAATGGSKRRGLGVGWLPVAFAVAQFGMTLLGWLAGEVVATVAASAMRWLAVAVLGLLGGKMLFFAEDPSTDNRLSKPLSWKLVALLAVLTSVDAAAAGLALDQLTDVPLAACAVIGAVTLLMSMAGLAVGKRVGARVGVMGERLGGLVLVSLAVLVAVSGE